MFILIGPAKKSICYKKGIYKTPAKRSRPLRVFASPLPSPLPHKIEHFMFLILWKEETRDDTREVTLLYVQGELRDLAYNKAFFW